MVSVDVKHHEARRRSGRTEPSRAQEKGDGAGLSHLDRFIVSLQSCSSTVASPDTVFVTLFRTAVERASCGVHKMLRTGEIPTSLTLLFWRWLTVSSVFAGRSAWTSYSQVHDPPLSPSLRFLWPYHHEIRTGLRCAELRSCVKVEVAD